MVSIGILELVAAALKENGFDGLYHPYLKCGCVLPNISPDDCLSEDCRTGYQSIHSVNGRWIVSDLPGRSDDEIQAVLDEQL